MSDCQIWHDCAEMGIAFGAFGVAFIALWCIPIIMITFTRRR